MSVELNSVVVVSYVYDSSSRLLQRIEGGTTTNYHWDGWDLVREEKTGTVTETTNYLCPQGEVLAFKRDGDWFYLTGDALSSTQLVTDESGDVVGRYVYGAWGDELVSSESIPGLFENRFVGGLGCRRDSATGMVYMRHRWYDCQLQRFISRDPIGFEGGSNLYVYAATNPATLSDPDGLDPSCQFDVIPKRRPHLGTLFGNSAWFYREAITPFPLSNRRRVNFTLGFRVSVPSMITDNGLPSPYSTTFFTKDEGWDRDTLTGGGLYQTQSDSQLTLQQGQKGYYWTKLSVFYPDDIIHLNTTFTLYARHGDRYDTMKYHVKGTFRRGDDGVYRRVCP